VPNAKKLNPLRAAPVVTFRVESIAEAEALRKAAQAMQSFMSFDLSQLNYHIPFEFLIPTKLDATKTPSVRISRLRKLTAELMRKDRLLPNKNRRTWP
jgi:hypothetical protein